MDTLTLQFSRSKQPEPTSSVSLPRFTHKAEMQRFHTFAWLIPALHINEHRCLNNKWHNIAKDERVWLPSRTGLQCCSPWGLEIPCSLTNKLLSWLEATCMEMPNLSTMQDKNRTIFYSAHKRLQRKAKGYSCLVLARRQNDRSHGCCLCMTRHLYWGVCQGGSVNAWVVLVSH